MANPKTKIKLKQLSGSLNTAIPAVSDQHQIADDSLQGPLDHIVTSIKKITGHDFFSPVVATLNDDDDNARIVYARNGSIIFKQEDGAADAVLIGSATATDKNLTAKGRILVDDVSDASTTLDGSIQTDGGLSVAKSVVIGDDLDLLSNGAILKVGDAQPFTLTHSNANNTLLASSGHRLAFGHADEHIVGDGTDLSIKSSRKLILSSSDAAGGELAIQGAMIGLADGFKQVTLMDNEANALEIGSTGLLDLMAFDTTNNAEKVIIKGLEVPSGDSLTLGGLTERQVVVPGAGGQLTGYADLVYDNRADGGLYVNNASRFLRVSGSAVIGGSATITGNLTVNGTTTTVNSDTVTIDDPIFTLGGDTAPTSDDNKDRGIEFRYHDGSGAKLGFFGMDDSDGDRAFTYISDASNTSEVFSGGYGNAKFATGSFHALRFDQLGAGVENAIHIEDNNQDSLVVKEGSNLYMKFDTQNTSEKIVMVKDVELQGGQEALRFTNAGENSIMIPNGQGDALLVRENANLLWRIDTNNDQIENLLPTYVKVDAAANADIVVVSNDHGGAIELREKSTNGNNFLRLRAPTAMTGDYTLTFPADGPGGANKLLQSDASGNLSFVDALLGGTRDQKIVTPVTASISATAMAGVEQGFDLGFPSGGHDLGAGGEEKCDIFVNGQLLTSGTSAANGDYKIHGLAAAQGGGTAAHACLFFFDLEADDLIQVVTYA